MLGGGTPHAWAVLGCLLNLAHWLPRKDSMVCAWTAHCVLTEVPLAQLWCNILKRDGGFLSKQELMVPVGTIPLQPLRELALPDMGAHGSGPWMVFVWAHRHLLCGSKSRIKRQGWEQKQDMAHLKLGCNTAKG